MASILYPKLYGVPLSPPFRSVAWLLLMKHIPFQIVVTVPGATTRIGTQHESYRLKTGVTTIPVLQTNESCYIPESPAILKHLCEFYGWHDFYPPYHQQDTHYYRLAMIDAYLHWHHAHTRRNMSKQLMPYVRPGLAQFPNVTGKTSKLAERHLHETLTSLNDFWLSRGDATNNNAWIASSSSTSSTTTPTCTIADLLAYEELVPLTMTGLLPGLVSSSSYNDDVNNDNDTGSMPVLPPDEQRSYYPAVAAWMDRMRTLPYHDAIHASITALGTLTPPSFDATNSEKEHIAKMNQLVGTATKIGLQAIQAAQDTYSTPPTPDVE
jgi:glutathione S-transferase